MIAHKPAQRFLQRRPFGAHAPARQRGHRRRVGLALDEGSEQRPGRDARDIGGDTGEFDVGSLQHLLQPVDHVGSLDHEVGALASEIPQVSLRTRGDEGGFDEPMAQQIGQPGGVLGIGLVAGDVLVVTGVDDPHLKGAFEEIVDRLPVLAGALHGDVRAAKLTQPVVQQEQGGGCRLEGACYRLGLAVWEGMDVAGNEESLVHIQSGTAFKQDLPEGLPPG